MEQSSVKKSLYVFLTAVLGILLFVTIQRSVSLIVVILLNVDYARYSFGTSPLQIHGFNIASMMLALFFGGWYGTWVGLHWYNVVYEHGGTGWLHGLSGGLFHGSTPATQKSTKPIVKIAKPKPTDMDAIDQSSSGWEFDDLLARQSTATGTTAKRTVRTVKKTMTTPRTRSAKTKTV